MAGKVSFGIKTRDFWNIAKTGKSGPRISLQVSSLCIMELVQGCRDRQELRAVKEFVRDNIAGVIHPDERISEKAITLLEGYALADGLRTVDAIVAATVLREDDTLVSANYKHFKKIAGLDVNKFEP